MNKPSSDAAAASAWSFTFRANPTHWHSSESDLSDTDEENTSIQETGPHSKQWVLGDLDLSAREDHAVFKHNPWSIAKINASSSICVPSTEIHSGSSNHSDITSKIRADTVKEQGALKRAFERQSARPAPKYRSNIMPATLGHVVINQAPTRLVRSQALSDLSGSEQDDLYGTLKTPQLSTQPSFPSPHNQMQMSTVVPSISFSSVNPSHSPQSNDSQASIVAHIPMKKRTQLRSSITSPIPSLPAGLDHHVLPQISRLSPITSDLKSSDVLPFQDTIQKLSAHHDLHVVKDATIGIRSSHVVPNTAGCEVSYENHYEDASKRPNLPTQSFSRGNTL
jgi:hypothetical protein